MLALKAANTQTRCRQDVRVAEAVQPTAEVAFKLWSATRGGHELESAPREDAPVPETTGARRAIKPGQ